MKKKKILIIDDDLDFVEATKIVLETKYHISFAYNGEGGRQKLKEEKPDLIILDIMMDGRNEGFNFSQEVRKNAEYSNIIVLMLTSMNRQTEYFPEFLPVDEFVEKPIDPQDLLKKIEDLLNKKEGVKHGSLKNL